MENSRYYKLAGDLQLRGWDRLPYAMVNRKNKRVWFIGKQEMDMLKLCSGTIDTSLPLVPEKYRNKLPDMEKMGMIQACRAGDAIRADQEYRQYPARYIRTAHWSLTGKCNYRCKHCYMSAPDAKLGELSHEAVMDMARQIADCGIMRVSLTGGEPLLRSDFLEIVDALLERDIQITTIYSNGALVSEKLLVQLEQRGIRPEFNMSYDGAGWHDWLRGVDGAEEVIQRAFLRCKEHGFPTGAEMCLHHRNKHTIRESVRNLRDWGCRSLKITPVSAVGAWVENGYGESIGMEELYQRYLDYIPEYYEDGMPLALQLGGFFMADPREPDSFDIPLVKECGKPEATCLCGHARTVLYISPEGRALPCMALSGMDIQEKFPLITEKGLTACLTDSSYMRMIDERLSAYLEHNPDCAACEHVMKCAGGCRAGGLEKNPADLLAPDLYACGLFQGGWVEKITCRAEAAIAKRKAAEGKE